MTDDITSHHEAYRALGRVVERLTTALRQVADEDCHGYDEARDSSEPCTCKPCIAKRALEHVAGWRFVTDYRNVERRRWNIREEKIAAAWRKYMTEAGDYGADQKLAQLLWDEYLPSPRDWFVATSIVQWLATNVGMSILEAAGFKYAEFDQDRARDDAADDHMIEPTPVVRLHRVEHAPSPRAAGVDRNDPKVKAEIQRLRTGPPVYGVTNRRHQVVTTGTKEGLRAFARALLAELERMG